VTQREWRRQVLPSYRGQAQEAVAQLRSRGIRASLEGDIWLVFDLPVEEGADPDALESGLASLAGVRSRVGGS
jgi:hypothetical protein